MSYQKHCLDSVLIGKDKCSLKSWGRNELICLRWMHICQSSQAQSNDFKDGIYTVCAKGNDSLELYEHKAQQEKARAIKMDIRNSIKVVHQYVRSTEIVRIKGMG